MAIAGTQRPVGEPPRPELALAPVLAIAGMVVAILLFVANGYGFHRDELYFVVAGRHPDWGYVDQPPLTPLLSAATVELLGLSPVAVRILPALCTGLVVLLAAAMAREFGGAPRAQLLAAGAVAVSGVLGLGHLGLTATYDMLVWTLILWLVVRLLAGADPRLWLAVGLVAGIGLQNKLLVVLLGIGIVIGLALARRGDVLRSGWAWTAVGLALVIWAPNLAWQLANGVPQLEMSRVIAERSSLGETLLVVPFQLILAGPLLWPVFLAGLWWLLRAPAGHPWRAVGWAYLAVLALTLALRGQLYYPAGLIPAIVAAGALPADSWLRRGQRRLRVAAAAAAVALSGASIAVIMLPILPPSILASTPIPAIYSEAAEQIGWPELAETVAGVVDELAPAERSRAVILTRNYGEAGALTLLGGERLPPVHSGHNAFGAWGPPPNERDLVILVGRWDPASTAWLDSCERQATIRNSAGIDNQEQGVGVWVCPERRIPWSEIWKEVRFLG